MPAPLLAARAHRIQPFHVMALLARARELEAAGRGIVHMEIGEPDFPTAEPVVAAGQRALADGHTGYLPAAGLPALREAIARHYADRYGLDVDPQRILVTPGASGALVVALALAADPGRNVLLPDPGYPCNRNFVELVDALPRAVAVGPDDDYQLTPALAETAMDETTAALVVGSPGNPTGTLATAESLQGLAALAAHHRATLIVDEIYHGLQYGREPAQALAHAPEAIVVNSFSKYFGMTGWRLGWMVVPEAWATPAEKLLQNLFISASAPAQYAALACFGEAAQEIFEARREAFRQRRDFLLPALRALGFRIPGEPAGAFYLYADVSGLTDDSFAFAGDLLERSGVAATPGLDFERTAPQRHLRFAYTTSLPQLEQGVERLAAHLASG
ncbi:pyridoxal phosphate-dependent aminotransferase [Sediminicurvatus halobius]|uniref:Aminotransferase n=1 Tax=Sediminicurvatus halobius TaxID=2182432 RepID=A0A2U2N3F0_9GAMM|nr:pyridoxal phosphate-dependent aminotransferase [Spiribacter halobius]PWG63504.1 pyridoxal phosphate-dependent aminotransferase [Spiribacter halobius]UEX79625.1 pyridoxal phosphate-dependent aminotransferase [Spiribacter halobius]